MASWCLSLAFSFLLLSQHGTQTHSNPRPAKQQGGYRTYSNARYNYSIAYPAALLVPQREADNGDGRKFLSKDGKAEMLVYGSQRMDRSLRDEYESALAGEGGGARSVTYKLLRKDWFVVSGTENGKVFYRKTLMRGDVFKTFIIEYDESVQGTYDQVTARVARSFAG